MQHSENPYQSSQAIDLSDVEVLMRTGPQIMAAAREIFVKWEKRRIGYNLTLIAVTIAIGATRQLLMIPNFWIDCAFGAIACNLCYFAGPIVEFYLTWLREKRHNDVGMILFVVGWLFSTFVAVGAILLLSHSWQLLPAQN
jgi:hypothetical protein